MAAELQSLLEKIQSEGVDKARAKADSILAEAEKAAAARIAEGEKAAAAFLAKAEAEAAVLRERSEQAVRQAARDVVLDVGQSIRQTLERVLLQDVDKTLSGDFLETFLASLVKAFAAFPDAAGGIEALVAPEQAERLAAYARARLAAAVAGGLRVAPDRDVKAGVRVMLAGGRVEHDFTDAAIQAAMSRMMSPALAKMVFGDAP